MRSLLGQLTLALCLAAGVLLPAGGAAVYFTARGLLLADFDSALRAKAEALLVAAEWDDGELELDDEVQEFAGFGSTAAGDYFEFRDPSGPFLAGSAGLRRTGLAAAPPAGTVLPVYLPMKLPDGRHGRVLWQQVRVKGDRKAPLLLLGVAGSDETLERTLGTLSLVIWTSAAVGLALTVGALRLTLRRGLRPVGSMAREVHAIAVENPDETLETSRLPSELLPVGVKVNELLTRARSALERERRFSSHAAHELRTPLAELRAMTELMATWTDEATPERSQEMLQVIDGMETLLHKLALLTRADAGAQTVVWQEMPLAPQVEATVQRFTPQATRRRLTWETAVVPGVLKTDPVLWEAILDNLLENAVCHAPVGSVIRIDASPARLGVTNAAPNLTQADTSKLMDRFWRKSTSREADSGPATHSGLGLSLVQAYAQLLGGHCTAHLTPDQRLTVEISWPPKASPP
jgi:signal transduction histidine kinase